MVPALIVMTILGCDDSVSQCHYVSTVKGTWETIATCDAESQKQLPKFNANYPVIVAVCEKADDRMAMARDPAQAETQPVAQPDAVPQEQPHAITADTAPVPPANETSEKPGLPRRTLAMLKGALPDTARLRAVVTAPAHYVEDGYSWVARRITN